MMVDTVEGYGNKHFPITHSFLYNASATLSMTLLKTYMTGTKPKNCNCQVRKGIYITVDTVSASHCLASSVMILIFASRNSEVPLPKRK